MQAVRGATAQLPCDIRPSDPHDSVHLVLWYRREAGKPLYSFDMRGIRPVGSGPGSGASLEDGQHTSEKEPFGSRAYFRVAGSDPAHLLISDVKTEVKKRNVTKSSHFGEKPLKSSHFFLCPMLLLPFWGIGEKGRAHLSYLCKHGFISPWL